ncbi:SMI1/KNR4 family protein [Pseudobacteroides cellulosolvens]|uniref:Cell wall assembly/cell proliferation coordinating protein, KNR4-like protein n=1 Tax=Pseudobacteroides cellulosolvens ATCC 35603 = DSM 2933 TaxID=398512 RepID=A0A0L6JWK4_9FIRM|nr:SMI1/KNR4 family protein [Pseudobacteroides cellulosolvens]KNY30129.1 Cell wall assembly/cell proliferation coordinating protein, KNR4-like protein [Pseudobacteroides cellulosolvens ATCC 35603 = DSM 2933]
MDYKKNKYFKDLDFGNHLSITIEDLKKVEDAVGISFPQQYKEFMLFSNGAVGEVGDSYLTIWELEDVEEFYEDCCKDNLDNIVLFASDGAKMGYGFDKNKNEYIVSVPLDSLEIDYVGFCANTFHEFIEYLYNFNWDEE